MPPAQSRFQSHWFPFAEVKATKEFTATAKARSKKAAELRDILLTIAFSASGKLVNLNLPLQNLGDAMKSLLTLSLLVSATVVLSGSVAWPAHRSPRPAEGVQTIEMIAKKYEFEPATIRVKQGTRVQLKIKATDHTHGFRISDVPEGAERSGKPGLVFASAQECTKIEEGKTEVVEFVAQTLGTYGFRCCVRCGWHHRAMKGELIIEP
jgi:plastocyanin